ncbi:MAG: hypothetical protein IKD18_04505 [Clostridia bacterium]|nr:hypothetical protein [Clostridia bacterium]
MTARLKTALCLLFPIALLFLALCFPAAGMNGVRAGLDIVAKSALPALFPALVLSGLWMGCTSHIRGKGALFLPLGIGLVCGFPAPAAVVAALLKEGVFSREQGEKMLVICNCASPAFLILLCGKKLMEHTAYGWFLWILQSLISLTSFFFLFYKELKNTSETKITEKKGVSIPRLLTKALTEASGTFLTVGATILFFSFFLALIRSIFPLPTSLDVFFSLVFELTGGISALSHLPKETAFPLCAAGVGFGGIAVYVQTLSVLE